MPKNSAYILAINQNRELIVDCMWMVPLKELLLVYLFTKNVGFGERFGGMAIMLELPCC